MKILLTTLNSKYIHSSLALKYLYESAGIHKSDVQIREFSVNQDDTSIYMELMRGGYDVICFSCYIWNITRTLGLIRDLKTAMPQVKIIVGGPEVTFEESALLERCPQIDMIIKGEGEKPFRFFMDKLYQNEDPFISKIVEAQQTPAAEIPFPYATMEPDPNKITYYESSRGCPYQCSFCISSTTKNVRFLPLPRVKKELDFFLEHRVKQVKLIDRTFNADTDRAAEILEYILERDNGVTNFHLELCGDRISQAMMDAFEEARGGLFQLEIGVQSTNEKTLQACGRYIDFGALSQNVKQLVALRTIHVHLDLIAGLPFETFDRFQESFDAVYELNPDDLQLGFLKMIKGSRIREEAEMHAYRYRQTEPYEVLSNAYITADQLVELKQVEHMLELFFNKPGFRNTLRYIISHYYESPFLFYHDLAQYYYACGYQNNPPAKAGLYEILLEYIEKRSFAPKEAIEELLQYDKIAVAAKSTVMDKTCSDVVQKELRKIFRYQEDVKVKDLLKQINYYKFKYNVSDYRYNAAQELFTEGDTLCIFFPEKKDAGGQSLEMCLPFKH